MSTSKWNTRETTTARRIMKDAVRDEIEPSLDGVNKQRF